MIFLLFRDAILNAVNKDFLKFNLECAIFLYKCRKCKVTEKYNKMNYCFKQVNSFIQNSEQYIEELNFLNLD